MLSTRPKFSKIIKLSIIEVQYDSFRTEMSLDTLQRFALISKVCSELDNHLGFSDKTLAEFIIHLVIKMYRINEHIYYYEHSLFLERPSSIRIMWKSFIKICLKMEQSFRQLSQAICTGLSTIRELRNVHNEY